ncbi:hypothetical protein Y032_0174g455 [Ancylostoma ceylanicum]|uniref:Uncharacterized protein n=1 Tax=Ancylostoma ceylanicum TaxID=53326 RepID=A0A016SUW7_9BILA|nr:hypothetical protein Y032_0174g455 [Ancylostoma ceylanicum]
MGCHENAKFGKTGSPSSINIAKIFRCRTRYPSSTQNHYDYSPQENRSSYRDSRIDSKGVTVVSRPGSPGPVAGAGDVVNTPHGFTIQLDVKLFRPEQIKVLSGHICVCTT